MASDISLTAAMRSNLISLQNTSKLIDTTQTRLSTGKKVNSALDNPTNFFVAANHTKRANDFTARKDGMTEAIQAIKAADNGISGIKALLEAASGLAESARSASTADKTTLAAQYDEVRTQIDNLITDSKYKGTNFLSDVTADRTLTVNFNADASTTLSVVGFDAQATAGTAGISAAVFTDGTTIDAATAEITTALDTLATESAKLASNLSIVNARLDFTTGLVNNEKTGADNLTLADMNEESANMLALQTRQNLGITSLSLASQAAQSILRLF